MQTLQNWLAQLPAIHDVKNIRVMIEGKAWLGCEYQRTLHYEQNMTACQTGEKTPADTYTETFVYLLGVIPPCLGKSPLGTKPYIRKNGNVCFTRIDSPFDWYLSGYFQNAHLLRNSSSFQQFNPFGLSFMLHAWDCGGKIDDFEPAKYKRIPITLTHI